MIGFIQTLCDFVNSFLWGPVMLAVFVGCGAYFTFKTSFLQIRKFPFTVTLLSRELRRTSSKDSISPFKALSTALAGTMGVGNIIGVATALSIGGAGSLFWMLVSAFLGMMTKYAEAVLSVKYRQRSKDQNFGGAMYYIEHGVGSRFLAFLFSLFCILACFGVGNTAQSNSAAAVLNQAFGIPKSISGIVMLLLVAVVIFGGIKRIASASAAVIPLLSVVYILMSLAVIFANITALPSAIKSIFSSAFNLSAAGGGILGFLLSKSVRLGLARGVFTNEAGMGSASIAHACSEENIPVKQGLLGIFEVFLDTFVVTTLTALVILCSDIPLSSTSSGAALAIDAFSTLFGSFGGKIISLSIFFFALPSIFGWAYYGERCVSYIFKNSRLASLLFKLIFTVLVFVGAVSDIEIVWSISDIFNGLMSIPNITALLILSPEVISETKKFFT